MSFFPTLCNFLGVDNVLATAYHPQTNGKIERCNKTIVVSLRPYLSEHQSDWEVFLPSLTYACNAQVHRTTNCRPTDLALMQWPPDTLLHATLSNDSPLSVSRLALLTKAAALRVIESPLTSVTQYMSNNDKAFQNRPTFAVDDEVFIKRPPLPPSQNKSPTCLSRNSAHGHLARSQ